MWKGKKKKKVNQMNTITLKVRMDCHCLGCVRKVKKALSKLKGVERFEVDMKYHKVTVYGYVDEEEVMKAFKSIRKKAEPWPYVPYTEVAYPYDPQVYDLEAPPNHVRATTDPDVVNLNPRDEKVFTMFSDENPNSCSVM